MRPHAPAHEGLPMYANNFSSQSSRPAARRRFSSRRRKFLRAFEQLEDRSLLAAFTVNSFLDAVDANPGDGLAQDTAGLTTLRAAIMEANARAGDDSVNLPAGVYTLTITGSGEDASATGDLDALPNGRLAIAGASRPRVRFA